MRKKIFPAIFLIIAFVAADALAQSAADQAVKSARDRFSDIKNRSAEMERITRDANKPKSDDNYKPKFPAIKDDFEQIQKISDSVVQLTNAKTPTDYIAVFKLVSEISHRAARLKSNLFSAEAKQKPEAKGKQQTVAESQDIKKLVGNLDKSIDSFAHNSMFRNLNVVNSQDSLRAQNDLETIIKISSAIKEKAKTLIKENSKK